MKLIDTPAGPVLHTGTAEEAARDERVLKARAQFVVDYCRSRGWPEMAEELSIKQILEIREQPGWKEPLA